ncbi:hypothetical protein [Methanosarcina sp. MTP4]|nr:hypothetical protein [Methanosarcina sp. MTP4]
MRDAGKITENYGKIFNFTTAALSQKIGEQDTDRGIETILYTKES